MIFERLKSSGAGARQRCSTLALALALTFTPAAALPAAAPRTNGWGVPYTDVTPDPAVRFGTLPNGLKYAVMKNSTPKGTASVRLHFAFGSLAESDREQGLAHFIEHMAFNGTTRVAEDQMKKILERQGLAFGPDTNARTGFDSTVYMLELPKADKERLDTAMFLLREVASEVKFDPAAVERERGVILSEKRSRENFQLRQAMDVVAFQQPETPLAKRFPIGTEEVLKSATAEEMRSLYRRYYRPENATLIFVGDADPEEIEARIRKSFGDWKASKPAGAAMPRGTINTKRPRAFDTFVDPAVATGTIYTVTRPWIDPPDTVAERQRTLIESIAINLFNRRIEKLSNVPGSSILGGGMGTEDQKQAGRLTSVQVTAKEGSWKDSVKSAEQEVRRALQHGFTANELATQLVNMEAALRTAAEQADTRRSPGLADTLLSVVDEDAFVTTPAYRYEFFRKLRPAITPERVTAAFRELWTGSAPLVHLSSRQAVRPAELAATLDESRKLAVAAPKQEAVKPFAYGNFGRPGTIAEDKRIADLDVRTIRFANNVRLNLKKTDFEAGRVRFLVRMGNGSLDLPLDKPGLAVMIGATSGLGALTQHSLEELKEITAGKVVTLGASVDDDAFTAGGATTRADLPLQMKLSAAYLTDPGFRSEAASQWANIVPIYDKQVDAQPQTVANARLPIVLANGDQRLGIPAAETLTSRNFTEARAAMRPVIASAPIDITIVGDFDEQSAVNAVASSFGALPARRLDFAPIETARRVSFRKDRSPILLRHEGLPDQALAGVAWPTDDDSNFRRAAGMAILARVIDLLLDETIREKLGNSYGVGVSNAMSDSLPGFGYLMASAVVAPDKVDEVHKAIEETAAELRAKPIDADLLARARTPVLEAIDRSRRENGYWIGALAKAQSEPRRLELIRNQKSWIQAITAAHLQKLAEQYLTPGTRQQVRIVSSKLATTASR